MELPGYRESEEEQKNNWSDFIIDRKPTADFLLKVFKGSKGPLSIKLDASYGTGKTRFFNCLQKQALKDGFIVIKYNAWEEETTLDARSSLCLKLLNDLREIDSDSRVANPISELQKQLLPLAGKLAISAISRLVFNNGDFISDTLKDAKIDEEFESFLQKSVETVNKNRASITSIRAALSDVQKSFNKPILIIIDELDRCRPDFSIEVLETIKHFFSIEGVFALVGIDNEVLESIIIKRYGRIDCENYLLRHFNSSIRFSKIPYNLFLSEHFKNLSPDEKKIPQSALDLSLRFIIPLCEDQKPSLRQLTNIINNFKLMLVYLNNVGYPEFHTFIYFMKHIDRRFFELCVSGEVHDKNADIQSDILDKIDIYRDREDADYLLSTICKLIARNGDLYRILCGAIGITASENFSLDRRYSPRAMLDIILKQIEKFETFSGT